MSVQPAQPVDRRKELLSYLAIAAAAGGLYLATLLPGAGRGDTAIFQFVGKVLGVPHPPGYPLHNLLSFVFVHLFPFGSPALRANLLSAAFSVAAACALFGLLRTLRIGRPAAVTACLTLSVTPVLWSQSIVAEVYSLHLLLMTLTLLGFVRWHTLRQNRDLLFGCAIYALSFGNHLTSLMLLPALVFLVAATDWRVILKRRLVAAVVAMIVLSALQYGYLPWRSNAPDTAFAEGRITNLEELWWFVRGGHAQRNLFPFATAELMSSRIPGFLRLLVEQFSLALVFALAGLWRFVHSRIGGFLAIYFVCNAAFALNYGIPEIAIYYIPNYLVTAVLLAAGLDALWQRIDGVLPRPAVLLLAVLPVSLAALHAPEVLRYRSAQSQERIGEVLDQVEDGTLVISPRYRHSATFWYYLIGEGLQERRRIYVVHHFQARQVADYVHRGVPFELTSQRIEVPPGLRVVCFVPLQDRGGRARKIVRELEARGLATRQVAEQLVAVHSSPPRSPATPTAGEP